MDFLVRQKEAIEKAQQEIMAKPVLSIEADSKRLEALEMQRDILRRVLLVIEQDGYSAIEAVDFWLTTSVGESEFVQRVIEQDKCCGVIPAIIMRWQRFQRLSLEIEFLRGIKQKFDKQKNV